MKHIAVSCKFRPNMFSLVWLSRQLSWASQIKSSTEKLSCLLLLSFLSFFCNSFLFSLIKCTVTSLLCGSYAAHMSTIREYCAVFFYSWIGKLKLLSAAGVKLSGTHTDNKPSLKSVAIVAIVSALPCQSQANIYFNKRLWKTWRFASKMCAYLLAPWCELWEEVRWSQIVNCV